MMEWKRWLEEFENNEFVPFKNILFPIIHITDNSNTEELIQQNNIIHNDKFNTQTSGSFRPDQILCPNKHN